jgi:hypothetical protein
MGAGEGAGPCTGAGADVGEIEGEGAESRNDIAVPLDVAGYSRIGAGVESSSISATSEPGRDGGGADADSGAESNNNRSGSSGNVGVAGRGEGAGVCGEPGWGSERLNSETGRGSESSRCRVGAVHTVYCECSSRPIAQAVTTAISERARISCHGRAGPVSDIRRGAARVLGRGDDADAGPDAGSWWTTSSSSTVVCPGAFLGVERSSVAWALPVPVPVSRFLVGPGSLLSRTGGDPSTTSDPDFVWMESRSSDSGLSTSTDSGGSVVPWEVNVQVVP